MLSSVSLSKTYIVSLQVKWSQELVQHTLHTRLCGPRAVSLTQHRKSQMQKPYTSQFFYTKVNLALSTLQTLNQLPAPSQIRDIYTLVRAAKKLILSQILGEPISLGHVHLIAM